jgi:membrane protein
VASDRDPRSDVERLWHYLQHGLWTEQLAGRRPVARAAIRLLRLAVGTAREFHDGDLALRAMGLVYTTLLSLVPFLAVAVSVLKAFGVHRAIEPLLARALAPLGEQGDAISHQMITFVDHLEVGVLGVMGVVGLLYTAVSLVGKIEEALNHVWRVRHTRPLVRRLSDYLSAILVGPVLVFAALALTASAQSSWLGQWLLEVPAVGPLVSRLGGHLLPLLVLAVGFTTLFRFLPNTPVPLKSAAVGGVSAALLWQATGAAFTAFVVQSPSRAAIYSGFAILVVFLIWLYVAWCIVLAGAAAAYCHQHPATELARALHRGRSPAARERLALGALAEVTRRHLAGQPPARLGELAGRLHAPADVLDELVDELVRRGIVIRAAEPRGLCLGRPPEQVAVADVLDAVREPGGEAGRPADEGDPVARLLARRAAAEREGLAGLTLRDLAGGV